MNSFSTNSFYFIHAEPTETLDFVTATKVCVTANSRRIFQLLRQLLALVFAVVQSGYFRVIGDIMYGPELILEDQFQNSLGQLAHAPAPPSFSDPHTLMLNIFLYAPDMTVY